MYSDLVDQSTYLQQGLSLVGETYDAAERQAYERASTVTDTERASYNTYRLAVRSAEASVREALGAYHTARAEREAASTLAMGTVAVREAERLQAEAVVAGESVVSDATLAELQAELRALDTMLGESIVKAPYTGTIVEVYKKSGDYVQPGTPILRMHAASGYEVEAIVAPRYTAGLIPGAEVVFSGGTKGTLDRISPEVDTLKGGVTIFIIMDSLDATVVSGTRIRGELQLATSEDTPVFRVPHEFVSFSFYGPTLYSDDATIPVEIVRDTASGLYVRGEMLRDGMTITH